MNAKAVEFTPSELRLVFALHASEMEILKLPMAAPEPGTLRFDNLLTKVRAVTDEIKAIVSESRVAALETQSG